jgi:4-hydroxybenzoate polyprenyltransferase
MEGAAVRAPSSQSAILAHISVARPDHWFKNVFMLLGIVLACLYYPQEVSHLRPGLLLWGLVSVCLVASSNYVVNELLDANTDRHHPTKRFRPIPSGLVRVDVAYALWVALGALGLSMAWFVNEPYFLTSLLLLVMGVIYNVAPLRAKDLAYCDVLTESITIRSG